MAPARRRAASQRLGALIARPSSAAPSRRGVVRARAEVRWVRDPRDEHPDAPAGVGLCFEDLAPEDARAIHAFVAARAPPFDDE